MASGKFDLSDNQAYQWAWVTYEEKNSSIANNTSDLLVNVYFRRSNNGYTSSGTMSTTVTVDGTPKSASKTFSNSGTTDSLVFSQTFTGIKHNTNGSKSVAISVSASGNQGFSGSGSKTVALDTIKRASVINSFRGNDIEGNFNVVYTSYSSSFIHKLRLSIKNGNTIETFNNYKSGTDVYFSNENVEYLQSYMESLPSVELSAVIETWDGSTKIGESAPITNTFSIDNALPIITATVVDVNDKTTELTNDPKILIKYYSNAKATMSVEAQKGAAIDESLYIIRNGSESAYSKEHTFNNVESNEFLFSAEDTRGNVGTATEKPTMIDYVKLTCNIANNRPDALGNMTVVCNGDYFNSTFGAVANTLTVQYRYTTAGSAFPDNWVNMNTTITGNSYIAYADFNIPDFVQTQAYSFETRAIDKLDTVSSSEPSVKSTPIFHWGENDFVFEVPVTFKEGASGVPMGNEVDGDLAVTGNLRLKGGGNYGNALLFGDGTYCYISEPEDDALRLKATAVEVDTLAFNVYGSPLYDFVIEQGSANSWTYRKWYSGVLECWITITSSTAIATAWGSLYIGANSTTQLDYPVAFISRPREIATSSSPNNYGTMIWCNKPNTYAKSGSYNVTRPEAVTTTQTIYYDIYAVGKWK